MAISKKKSFTIFWPAVKSALGITAQDPDDMTTLRNSPYSELFNGWTSNVEDADRKIAEALIQGYESQKYAVNSTSQKLANLSKGVRISINSEANRINDFFYSVHDKILD